MNRLLYLWHKRRRLNEEVKVEKRKLHKEFVEEHRKLFWALDIGCVIVILLNFFSLMLTNAMVMKEDADAGITPEFAAGALDISLD